MLKREEVIKVQEIANNAWPAKEVFFLNGWIIRFSDGATSRANSVLPLDYRGNDLESDILKVEETYRSHDLNPIFMLHDYYCPSDLHSKLLSIGYQPTEYTVDIMGLDIENFLKKVNQTEFKIESSLERTKEWSEALFRLDTKRTENVRRGIFHIMDRIVVPQKRYFSIKVGKQIIGILLGILDRGYLGIMYLIVDPEFRRRGAATMLLANTIEWTKQRNGRYMYLQVVRENQGAVQLYKQLNFKNWFSYYYMMK